MTSPLHAVHVALRSLRRARGHTTLSLLVLGLSTGSLLATAAVVDAILLRPPSARAPAELVYISSSLPGGVVSRPDFEDLRERVTRLAGACAYAQVARVTAVHHGTAVAAPAAAVSGTYFPVLGVNALEGRALVRDDDRTGAEPVALLTEGLARRLDVAVGELVELNTRPFRVVGLMSDGLAGIDRTVRPEIWFPLQQIDITLPTWLLTSRASQWLNLAGRLAPGETAASLAAELEGLAAALGRENPDTNHGMTFRVRSFAGLRLAQDQTARTMTLLAGTVGVFFALAFVNFMGLALLRLFARRKELALRMAVGADRVAVAQLLAIELGLLLAGGFVLGVGCGWGLLHLLRLDPRVADLVQSAAVRLDARVVLFGFAASALAGGLTAVIALRKSTALDLSAALREAAGAPGRRRAVESLFTLQVALSLFLIALAAAFAETLHTTATRPVPFRTERVLAVSLDLRPLGWAGDRAKVHAFHARVLAELQRLPGVEAAGASTSRPLEGAGWSNVIVDGRDPATEPDQAMTWFSWASSGYFEALAIRVHQGRVFSDLEVAAGTRVAVINRAMARRFWPGQDAIGKSFRPWETGELWTVVGIVDDVPPRNDGVIRPWFYLPYTETAAARMCYLVAVRDEGAVLQGAVNHTVGALWPGPGAPTVSVLREQITATWSDLWTSVRIMGWIASLAALVTAFGLYSFSSYAAARTVRDSAVRLALGGSWRRVAWTHVARYRSGMLAGFFLGGVLVFAARPLLARAGVALALPGLPYVGIAAAVLGLFAGIGLFAPTWRLRRMDVQATLRPGE